MYPSIAGPFLAFLDAHFISGFSAAQIKLKAGGCIVEPWINKKQPTHSSQKVLC